MKKLIYLILSVLLLLSLMGCEAEKTPEFSLYDRGMELAALLSEMVKTEGYLDVYTASGEIRDIAAFIGEGDYTVPKACFAITVPEDTLAAMAELSALEGASQQLQDFVTNRTVSALPSQINAGAGAEKLAASSIITASTSFSFPELKEPVIHVYTYQNGYSVAVVFIPGQDGTVSATGTFLLNEVFQPDSPESIADYFFDLHVEVSLIN